MSHLNWKMIVLALVVALSCALELSLAVEPVGLVAPALPAQLSTPGVPRGPHGVWLGGGCCSNDASDAQTLWANYCHERHAPGLLHRQGRCALGLHDPH